MGRFTVTENFRFNVNQPEGSTAGGGSGFSRIRYFPPEDGEGESEDQEDYKDGHGHISYEICEFWCNLSFDNFKTNSTTRTPRLDVRLRLGDDTAMEMWLWWDGVGKAVHKLSNEEAVKAFWQHIPHTHVASLISRTLQLGIKKGRKIQQREIQRVLGL
jgi:hypothetical protein